MNFPRVREVEFEVLISEEPHSPADHIATGDDEADARWVEETLKRVRSGGGWAWCCVQVRASFDEHEESDYLGACSYKSEEDFKKHSGYYREMKAEAYERLILGMAESEQGTILRAVAACMKDAEVSL